MKKREMGDKRDEELGITCDYYIYTYINSVRWGTRGMRDERERERDPPERETIETSTREQLLCRSIWEKTHIKP